jgi:hypothetical protein
MLTSVPSPNTLLELSRGQPSSFSTAVPRTRYTDSGEQLILNVATKAVEKLRSLPASEKESYASGFN